MSEERPAQQKTYTNGEITVIWQPEKCIHSTRCWKGLYRVFNPKARPWVNMEGASSQRIREQVDLCPSGALSWRNNNAVEAENAGSEEGVTVEVSTNGPLLVHGKLVIKHPSGKTEEKTRLTAFCRCGGSGNKPYCDGSHRKNGFSPD